MGLQGSLSLHEETREVGRPQNSHRNYLTTSYLSFVTPDPTFAAKWNQTFDPSTRGVGGPIDTIFPDFLPDAELPQEPSALELGIPIIKEPVRLTSNSL